MEHLSGADPQRRLAEALASRGPRTVVVCPSVSLDPRELRRIGPSEAFEERLLFHVGLLREADTRLIYLSSRPLPPASVEVALALLRAAGVRDPEARFLAFSTGDDGPGPLARKLLDNPFLLRRVRAEIRHPERSWLEVYRSTELERGVARALGLPALGAAPELAILGTKSGSRRLLREAGVAVPHGVEGLRDEDDLAEALVGMARRHRRVVVKLEDACSGRGNGVLDLSGLRGVAGARRLLRTELRLQDTSRGREEFLEEFRRGGGIVEALLEGPVASPSVQILMSPGGSVRILSTHDQILSGHSYRGCRLPAPAPWRRELHEAGLAVGRLLAARGAVGHASVDFVATTGLHAIEINLRKGGTTLPLYTLELAVGGAYDTDAGEFLAPDGSRRTYVSSDRVAVAPGRSAAECRQALARTGLGADIVLHMLGAVETMGMVGATAIGRSEAEAASLFARVEAAMRRKPKRGWLRVPRLPDWTRIASRRRQHA